MLSFNQECCKGLFESDKSAMDNGGSAGYYGGGKLRVTGGRKAVRPADFLRGWQAAETTYAKFHLIPGEFAWDFLLNFSKVPGTAEKLKRKCQEL